MLGGFYVEDDDRLLLFTYPLLSEQHYGFPLQSSQWTGFGQFKVFGMKGQKPKNKLLLGGDVSWAISRS